MTITIEHQLEIAEHAAEHGIPLCPACGDFHHPGELHSDAGPATDAEGPRLPVWPTEEELSMTTATATAVRTAAAFTIQRRSGDTWETVRPASKKYNGKRDVAAMATKTGVAHRLVVGDGWDDQPVVVCEAGDTEPADTDAELALVGDEPGHVDITVTEVVRREYDEMTGAGITPRTPAADRPRAQRAPSVRGGEAERLASGGLRGMVSDWLTANPGAETTPSKLGKVLGRSSGAVHNALETLIVQGLARRTSDKPKTYASK